MDFLSLYITDGFIFHCFLGFSQHNLQEFMFWKKDSVVQWIMKDRLTTTKKHFFFLWILQIGKFRKMSYQIDEIEER